MKKITLKDLAQLSNCTVSTVSRALHGNPRIPLETRKRIMQIAKETKYLAAPKKRVVAIIGNLVDYFPDYYMQYLLFLIAQELSKKRFRSMTIYAHDMTLLNTLYITGAISLMPFHRIARRWSVSSPTPLVTVNDYGERSGRIFSVCSDEVQTMSSVVEKLIARGCRHPGFFSLEVAETYCSRLRLDTYLEMMGRFGIKPRVFSTFDASSEEFVKSLTTCDSFILPGESLGSLIPQLHALMPDAILAVWRYTQEFHPDEICVTQDYAQIAARAVSLLEKQIANETDLCDEHICCEITEDSTPSL